MLLLAKAVLRKLQKLVAKAPELVAQTLTLGALVAVSFGAGMSVGEHKANVTTVQHATKLISQANHGTNPVVPATVQPPTQQVASYTVPASYPRYLTIPRLGVHARVLTVGLAADKSIGTPSNVYDTAWYSGSAKPGEAGAMLIDGHVSSWTTQGVFYGLGKLQPGDTIQVERGDSAMFTYRVIKSVKYDASAVDMAALLSPVSTGKPGLNLITCTGSVIPGTNDFSQRLAVFTEQI